MKKSGVISRAGLLGLGWTDKGIRMAIETEQLSRVAHGWFANPQADPWVIEAIRAGGRLGCLSGCKFHGLWTPSHTLPHVVVGKSASRSRSHWHRHYAALPAEPVFPLLDCLAQVIRHHSPEQALIVLESAVNRELITVSDAHVLMADAPSTKQNVLKFFDPRAESGSETKVRLWLQRHRFPVQSQVVIPGVGRVDHLIGRSLITECDSAEFHPYREDDYTRFMNARSLGYTPVGLGYGQIHYTWDDTAEVMLRILRTGKHLLPPLPP